MFSDLFDYGKDRNTKEAFGFYIAYTIMGLLALFILGIVLEIMFSIGLENGKKLGYVFAIIVPITISFIIINKKNTMKFTYILLALLSGILGLFGAFIGLIPTAYLTTRISNKKRGVQ